MKIISRIIVAFLGALFLGTIANATSTQPNAFLGPTIKGSYTQPITKDVAYSIGAEAAYKNLLGRGVLGVRIADNQRFKIAAEYLGQKLSYRFFDGDAEQWVTQAAVGAYYQYDFGGFLRPQFDLSAYVSHAPSKSLSTRTGTTVSATGVQQVYTAFRRIAGSTAEGVSPGFTLQPWWGAAAGLDLNYDNVSYDTKNIRSRDAQGFGGTARLNQELVDNLNLGLSASMRQPFNNYEANLNWTAFNNRDGKLIIGLEGDYLIGKRTLPNSYNVGLNFNFIDSGDIPQSHPRKSQKHKHKHRKGYKGEWVQSTDDFLTWTSDPVVLPTVLAITDEKVNFTNASTPAPTCTLAVPTFVTPIGNQTATGGVGTFTTAQSFSGQGLTFSINIDPTFTGNVSIDPITGIVTLSQVEFNATGSFTVSASNCAGSVTSNTFTISGH